MNQPGICFDHRVQKYDDPREILQEYSDVRLQCIKIERSLLMSHLQKIIDKPSFPSQVLNPLRTGELEGW